MTGSEIVPGTEARLGPELMAEVCKALNFDPAAFAKRHGEEFIHQYLRVDGMLGYVGEEILSYLARRVNECLSKAEYALLSYIEYAGRGAKEGSSDCFAEAVARFLKVRRKVGSGWVYAFEDELSKGRCLEVFPQMYTMAKAMYAFARETGEFKEVSKTDGPETWPDPQKMRR